jgi:CTP synthase
MFMLISYFPIPSKIGEMKTKPTQHAVRALNSAGIEPDFIIARSLVPLDEPRKKKLSIFCNVRPEDIISAPDIENIYQVPLNFEKENLGNKILKKFGLSERRKDLGEWAGMVKKAMTSKKELNIGIVGKYFGTGKFTLSDSYISVIEAVKHACWHFSMKPNILWLDAEDYEKNPKKMKEELSELDGIIVPGGFGSRGVEGKIKAISYARKNKKPYLGLCYGMQLAVIEFARNVAGMNGAHTTEVNPRTKYPVIDIMAEQKEKVFSGKMGGSMRLGAYACRLKDKTMARKAYGERTIYERHRHRYEFNNALQNILESKGLICSGTNPESGLVERVELKDHPFFMGSQFHPEFKSRPLSPHPLFREFVRAAIAKKK